MKKAAPLPSGSWECFQRGRSTLASSRPYFKRSLGDIGLSVVDRHRTTQLRGTGDFGIETFCLLVSCESVTLNGCLVSPHGSVWHRSLCLLGQMTVSRISADLTARLSSVVTSNMTAWVEACDRTLPESDVTSAADLVPVYASLQQ